MNKARPTKRDVALEQFKSNSIFACKDVLELFDGYVREARQMARERDSWKDHHHRSSQAIYEQAERLNQIAGGVELKPFPKLRTELRGIADRLLSEWRR